MDPEEIVRNIGIAIALFVEQYTHSAAEQLRLQLQNWDVIWPQIRDWLICSEDSLKQGTVATILSFVQNIPHHESFLDKLHLSLTYQREFWDTIHDNFSVARNRLVA